MKFKPGDLITNNIHLNTDNIDFISKGSIGIVLQYAEDSNMFCDVLFHLGIQTYTYESYLDLISCAANIKQQNTDGA